MKSRAIQPRGPELFAFLACLSFFAVGSWAQTPLPPGHLIGAVEGSVLPSDVKVCLGSPVVLNVTWVADGPAQLDRTLDIRYELTQGTGWFETFDKLKPSVASWKDRAAGYYRAIRQGKKALSRLVPGGAGTALVFHPLGSEDSQVAVRVGVDPPDPALPPIEYHLRLGRDRSSEFAALVRNGVDSEEAYGSTRFEYDETIKVQSFLHPGKWSDGKPLRIQRILDNGSVVSKYVGDDRPRTDRREPFDAAGSPYNRCVYWGEEGASLIGCMMDPGDAGGLMLYTFDGKTGEMTAFREYGPSLCGWGTFTWSNPLNNLPFMTGIAKRVWSPPGRLVEDTLVQRDEFHLLP